MTVVVGLIFCAVLGLSFWSAVKACREGGMESAPAGMLNPLRQPATVVASLILCLAAAASVCTVYVMAAVDPGPAIATGIIAGVLASGPVYVTWRIRHVTTAYRPACEWLARSVRLVLLVLATGALLCVGLVWLNPLSAEWWPALVVIIITVSACFTAAALIERAARGPRDEERAHACRTAVRSALPVLAICVAALSLGGGIWLRRAETRYARAANETYIFQNDIELTRWADVQREVREMVREWEPPSD
jgi:heme/copper-type cytochrome/quinol oxidase subunit 2